MELRDESARAVADLADAVQRHDGVAAFSEDTLLNLQQPDRPRHLIEDHGRVAGFAQLNAGSVELAVHPDARRRGVGTTLLTGMLEVSPDARFWAHGDLPAAVALAQRHELVPVRELWRMSARPPTSAPAPDGDRSIEVRTFAVGTDETDWLRQNARAFADHPEQGRLTAADLQARMDSPWFDPRTFWLATDRRSGDLLGSMWVKIITDAAGARSGEIYVLGVDPDAQGRGVGKLLTDVAMHHFATAELDRLELYVEADNAAAIAIYARAGFFRDAVHVQYAPRHSLTG